MHMRLFMQAVCKFLMGVFLLALLLFLPAGTFRFWNAWLLLGLLFIPMFLAGIVMLLRSPELLQKRLNAKEKQQAQKAVLAWSGILFLSAFVTAGLNWRFRWITLPHWAVWTGAALFLAGYVLYALVLRENAFLSRTVEIQENQKVIDTGLYGVVRHPMYAATLLLFPSMGLVLGSPISFAILLLFIPILVLRIRNEEKVLSEGLDGYTAYCRRVKFRLIPFLW